LALVLLAPAICAYGITGYFRLGSETKALQRTVMKAMGGECQKKFAIHAGWLTMGAVRLGTRWVNMPPEPRAALEALRTAEVGVYALDEEPAQADSGALFQEVGVAMGARGWDRIVGVAHGKDMVSVFIPHKANLSRQIACCLMVVSGRNLVIASVRGNPGPLLEIAQRHIDKHGMVRRHGAGVSRERQRG